MGGFPPYKGTDLLHHYSSGFLDSSSRLTCVCEIPSSLLIFLKLMPWALSFLARWWLCCLLSLLPAMYSSRGTTPSERLFCSFRSRSRCRLASLEMIVFRCCSSSEVILSLRMISSLVSQ